MTDQAPSSSVATSTPLPAGCPRRIGRFELRSRLGAGAFGTVYLAHDPQLERDVALKVPRRGTLDSPVALERFLREARAASRLQHPHIVPVYDAGRDGEHHYIASAFIDGRALAHVLDAEGPFDARQAAQTVRELAEALAYAHNQGIVHRDVKPANVMLDKQGRAHLMDFGLAHGQDSAERLTQEGAILGTPSYMAPEVAGGQRGEPLPASDQYALGVVLYELLCGRPPFEGLPQVVLYSIVHRTPPPPRQVNAAIPRDLERVCLKALARQPADRYAGCGELADDLRRWLEGEPLRARPLGPAERLLRWCRREPVLALSGMLAALGLVSVVALSTARAMQLRSLVQREAQVRQEAELAQQEEAQARAFAEKEAQREQEAKEAAEKQKADTARALEDARKATRDFEEAEARAEDERKKADAARARLHQAIAARAAASKDAQEKRRLLEVWLKQAAELPLRTVALSGRPDGNVAFGPAGKSIALAIGQQVRACDSATGREIFIQGASTRISMVAYHPDGTRLAAGTRRSILLWDTRTRKVVSTLVSRPLPVDDLTFSPDGKYLASADGDGSAAAPARITLWDAVQGRELRTCEGHTGRILCLTFRPDGKVLASAGSDGSLCLWETATGKSVRTLARSIDTMTSIAFSPDGKRLVSAGTELRIWDLDLGKSIVEQPAAGLALFSPDGRWLAATHGAEAAIHDAHTGKELFRLRKHTQEIRGLTFIDEGRRLLTVSADGVAHTWDTAVMIDRLASDTAHKE